MQHICQSAPLTHTHDYGSWHNRLVVMEKLRVAREYRAFLLVSTANSPGWLIPRLFCFQPHAVEVLHANTLLDLNDVRCESNEGQYQDDWFNFLFFSFLLKELQALMQISNNRA